MKGIRKSTIALFLTIIMAISSFAIIPVDAATLNVEESGASVEIESSGAVAYPSGTTICYALSDGRVNTYTAKGSYTGYIDGKNDQCKILSFSTTSGRIKVSYPTSKGTKTAYAPLSSFVYNTGFNRYKGKIGSNVKVFTKSNMSKQIGTAYKNDSVWVVSKIGNKAQIIYPISGGYKMGWIYTSAPTTTYYVTTTSGLYLRQSASTKSKALIKMDYASALSVSSISNGWAKATYTVSGKTYSGYCSSSYISTTKPVPPVPNKKNLSAALYNNSSAYISCSFDGYKTTKGRHEGIDVKLRNNAPIYSLTDGVIVRVTYGYNGSYGLSTIAIYNSATNKTVIYLHSAPVAGLKTGQSIKKGQKIGQEGWRGVSSSSASHTHVEVRNGKQSSAAKSVNDYKLDNTNPTSFWNSMGYNVK